MSDSFKKYKLLKLVSKNDLCQSWVGHNNFKNSDCFLKVAGPKRSLDYHQAKEILLNSYSHQSAIHTASIITARDKSNEKGCLFLEYPLLTYNKWTPADPALFWRNYKSILIQIGIMLDYLHSLGLVHCDLKLSNFIFSTGQSSPKIRLLDMDFLARAGSKPRARIMGTPEHIAPEIISNEEILTQSDMYSLGVSLRHLIDTGKDGGVKVDSQKIEKIDQISNALTVTDPLSRPSDLIPLLFDVGLITEAEREQGLRATLSMILLSAKQNFEKKRSSNASSMVRSILSENRIFGVHRELSDMLSAENKLTRLQMHHILKNIVIKSKVIKYGDYWQLVISDENIHQAFTEQEKLQKKDALFNSPLAASGITKKFQKEIEKLRDEGHVLVPFLLLKETASNQPDIESVSDESVWAIKSLAELSELLGRTTEAYDYLKRLAGLLPDDDARKENVLIEECHLAVLTGVSNAFELVENCLKNISDSNASENKAGLLRIKGWLLANQRQFKDAEQHLNQAMKTASDADCHSEKTRILYSLGVMHWLRGDYAKAEDFLKAGIKTAKEEGIPSEALNATAFLAFLYFDTGEYRKSINTSKLALRYASKPRDDSKIALISKYLASSYSRLCMHKKAEYWLAQSLVIDSTFLTFSEIISYYTTTAFIKLNAGQFRESLIAAKKGEALFSSKPSTRFLGKIFHILSELAFFRGELEKSNDYAASAIQIFYDKEDNASVAETKYISAIADVYLNNRSPSILLDNITKLSQAQCIYYRVSCLFHILISSDKKSIDAAVSRNLEQVSWLLSSRVPLFHAVGSLLEAHSQSLNRGQLIVILKSIYRHLYYNGYPLQALVTCECISNQYWADSNSKLAQKFLLQAIAIAQKLSNSIIESRLQDGLNKFSTVSSMPSGAINSLRGISTILKDVTKYKSGLQRIIEFAVEQTGAERGVLLLRAISNKELQVKAFVNCDETSLVDIKDFSSRIPAAAVDKGLPMVIGNAQQDETTKSYKSVIEHNILSVLCIPIIIDEQALGVIYLDHHTIPALFEPEDVTYAEVLSNFISVMIKSIDQYRTSFQTNLKLSQNAAQQGFSTEFITNSEIMVKLLSKLPEIARSDVNVLIVGESGTGKEILCNIIHNLSSRSKKPFVKMNCASVASSMVEGELFGVAKGAATGVGEREGKFEAADGGTLLLDEVGDMPPNVQAMVLRVIEYKHFERVGSNRTSYSDVRLIFATNRDLKALVKEGKFREDLYYRMRTIEIDIPPLRERREDIIPLVEHFLSITSKTTTVPIFTASALQTLARYSWPGNVRQLKNEIDRCCILHPGIKVDVKMLSAEITESLVVSGSTENLKLDEKILIENTLSSNNWNLSKASQELGIPRTTLRRKIKILKIIKKS